MFRADRQSAQLSKITNDQLNPVKHRMPCSCTHMAAVSVKGLTGSRMWGYELQCYTQDITQQQLCDLTAVSLVEKCTRFHIFCSEAMCEEDMAVFDPKINNENLTKCLQTLKEMYGDLSSQQDVVCPWEAEFRAYMVLMRLNDGDTLR